MCFFKQISDIGSHRFSGDDGKLLSIRFVRQCKRRPEFRLKQTNHPHSVLQLGVLFVILVRGKRDLRFDVHLVGTEEDAAAVFPQTVFGK